MTLKKVVLAYDGSDDSKKALQWSVNFASQTQVETVIASVLEMVPYMMTDIHGSIIVVDDYRRESLERALESAEAAYREKGLPVTTTVLEGNPADALIKYAESVHADLIICGTRGLGGFNAMLLGSVAHKLVTYSPVSVLVIK